MVFFYPENSFKKMAAQINHYVFFGICHWGKADDRNCNYGHPRMADMKLGKNLFCRLNSFYNACIRTIVIYELFTRKSQITTDKCI